MVAEESVLPAADGGKGGTAYELTVRLPDYDGNTASLSGLEVKAAPPVARPVSLVRPPIPMEAAIADLKGIHFYLREAARNGDCFVLSSCAGFEIEDPATVARPTLSTLERVESLRGAAVDLLTGEEPIGGVPASLVQRGKAFPPTQERRSRPSPIGGCRGIGGGTGTTPVSPLPSCSASQQRQRGRSSFLRSVLMGSSTPPPCMERGMRMGAFC